MKIWNNVKVRDKQHTILVFLYRFRGATNEQLRRYLYGHCDSKRATQLANTSKFVSQLKKDKMIRFSSCLPYRQGEINYLSPKGIQYIYDTCDIDVSGDPEKGFEEPFGEFEYDTLKPPLNYLEHHLMYVDLVLKEQKLKHRNSLYAVRKYTYEKNVGREGYIGNGRLRPDGEMLVETKDQKVLAAIEVDTGSERYQHLVEKFRNYKRFFDYCTANDLDIPYFAIYFQTKQSEQKRGWINDKRAITVLKAASEGLSYYCWTIEVFIPNRCSMKRLLDKNLGDLERVGVCIPPKENPILAELEAAEKRKIAEEKAQLEAIRRHQEQEKQAEMERQQRLLRQQQALEREKFQQEMIEQPNKGFFKKLFK
ncbi:replication-relaxation family protein (plasmid) [Alkalihalophilus pseudofirmus]|uniref:replication-relaxation family protein n=1 Tax=Alkalihalophilus pseudofirmus TaxID=79885 RepID=UPI00259B5801|nr:replication-relaxation family protein [Alkalihalophilus pseudofirmus]WEG19206.1 replication-relaxation family protein [Alkalihalophilus pseudofirmus]